MASRVYYFGTIPFNTEWLGKQVDPAAGAILVPPFATSLGWIRIMADDGYADDLTAMMESRGYHLLGSEPSPGQVLGQTRDYGTHPTDPVVPPPGSGDHYFSTFPFSYERFFDGVVWRPRAPVQPVEVAFTFATVSPLLVTGLRPGDRIVRSDVKIGTAFDGVGAALMLGTAGSPGVLLDTGDIDVVLPDEYEAFDELDVGVLTLVQLAITPGAGATAGAGRVLLEIWRA